VHKRATFRLTILRDPVAIVRLPADTPQPAWADQATQFLTVSRTPTELSIVADERVVPLAVAANRGYRLLRVEGPLPLELVGVFASLAGPLADAEVSIMPIGTFDTDYILVASRDLERAAAVLRNVGHVVDEED
jgi:hypothetical protein